MSCDTGKHPYFFNVRGTLPFDMTHIYIDVYVYGGIHISIVLIIY